MSIFLFTTKHWFYLEENGGKTITFGLYRAKFVDTNETVNFETLLDKYQGQFKKAVSFIAGSCYYYLWMQGMVIVMLASFSFQLLHQLCKKKSNILNIYTYTIVTLILANAFEAISLILQTIVALDMQLSMIRCGASYFLQLSI